MGPGGVRLDVEGAVARVTLCRPERRNAQTPATWLALAAVPEQLGDDVRVVLVAGEGPSFSAGLDRRMLDPDGVPGEGSLADLTARSDADVAAVIASYQAGFSWLRTDRFVSVAAVRGHAVGAGFQLALACDLRVAADDAMFTMAEPTLGLVPDLGGTQPLVEAIGYAKALEICATGRRIGAVEAERCGLVNIVVPGDALDVAVDDLVAALLTTDRDAVRATKRLLLDGRGRVFEEQLRAEREAQVIRLRALTGSGSADAETAVAAQRGAPAADSGRR
jgi:enoyl-CoA hydratase/carnithine racemase